MNNELLIVANWKMNISHDETFSFVTKHYDDLSKLAATTKHTVVLCPSFTTLYPLHNVLKDTPLKLGAQD
jgi:triosephosphate isomerase